MEKDIEEAVMAIPAGDEEHQEVLQAIDEFEEGVKLKPQGDKRPNYYVKYCRGCELSCPPAPGGEVGDGLTNRYDMILLIKSGPCVTDPSALISGRNLFSLIRPYNMLG